MQQRDPFRLRVLKAMTDTLAAIHPDKGYRHDLTGRVFRGRNMYGDNDPIPLVSILEAPLPDEPMAHKPNDGVWVGQWRLFVQGWVDDDRNNPTDPAHYLLADVKRALAEARRSQLKSGIFNMSRVTNLTIGANVVRPAEEHVNEYANFLLVVTLEIAENMMDPYE